MPGRDGSGPTGQGPDGIRGTMAGRCIGPEEDGMFFPGRMGQGYRGRQMAGRGPGRGVQRGYRGRYRTFQQPPTQYTATKIPAQNSDQVEELKNRIDELQVQLEESMNLIEELKNKEGNK